MVRGYHPRKIFQNSYAKFCILVTTCSEISCFLKTTAKKLGDQHTGGWSPNLKVGDQSSPVFMVISPMVYRVKRAPAKKAQQGLSVTLPTRQTLDPKDFTNVNLTKNSKHTAVISLKRVSAASVLQLYIHVGHMTAEDYQVEMTVKFSDFEILINVD